MNIASVLQALASLSWLAAIGALGFAVFNAARGRKFGGGAVIVIGAVLAAVVLTSVAAGLVFVEPDERGVVISALAPKGYRDEALNPGLHWIIPFAERVQMYTIKSQTYTMSSTSAEGQVPGDDSIRARTKDGQEVFIEASVIYAINPDEVVQLHITWQDRYQDEVIRPLTRGIMRDATSQYGVEEIVSTKRIELEEIVTAEMERKLAENNLLMADFVLRDIHFSEEYAAAVEQKQIAEQLAQQAAFVVEQRKQEAEQARQVAEGQADAAVLAAGGRAKATVLQAQAEAEARVIQAKAEAEALQLISQALTDNPDLLTYRYIEKLAPNVQVMYLPSGSPYLIPLPTAASVAETVVTPVQPTPAPSITP